MKLSIIVPVYNVEKYIVKCIASLLDQNFDDYEIIVVNDGTEDKSIELINHNFKDGRISIINQRNSGLSSARNSGLMASRGEYVWFVDSDDWIAPQSLSGIAVRLRNCDIMFFTHVCSVCEETRLTVINSYDIDTSRNLWASCPPVCVPYYIFRKEFLIKNDLSFRPEIFHEDNLFTPRCLYLAKVVTVYPGLAYYRLLRKGSIMHTVNPKRCMDLCIVISDLVDFADREVKFGDRYLWGNFIADTVNGLLYLSVQTGDYAIRRKVAVFFQEHSRIIDFLIHSRKLCTRLLGYAALLSGGNILNIYKWLYYVRYFPKSFLLKTQR